MNTSIRFVAGLAASAAIFSFAPTAFAGDSATSAATSATTSAPADPAAVAVYTPAAAPAAPTSGLPEPILGNTGAYMCPFTEDGTVSPWVEKGMTAAVAGNVGGAVGAFAGQKALEQIPFLGGFLGKKVGEATGRQLAISSAGGWDFIKSSSDLSFNSLQDMAKYVNGKYASHPQFAKVLDATYGIYPDFRVAVAANP